MGDTYSVAWRTVDAQYWGVPQRRKRIYLVADLDAQRAGEVLFKSESLSGYSAEGFKSWQGAACGAESGVGETGTGLQLIFENHSQDTRYTEPVVGEIQAFGVCSKDSNAMKSDNPNSGFYEADTSRTLDANGGNPNCNQGGMAVVAYGIDRAAFNQGKNAKYDISIEEERNSSLVAKGPSAVAYGIGNGQAAQMGLHDKMYALDCMHDQQAVMCDYIVRRLTPTECARLQGFPDWWCDDIAVPEPTEDDMKFWRGVFDTYADINEQKQHKTDNQIRKWLANPHTDSAEYKMWGNGCALPNAYYVIFGISEVLREEKSE